jgi:hypothetical protein
MDGVPLTADSINESLITANTTGEALFACARYAEQALSRDVWLRNHRGRRLTSRYVPLVLLIRIT